MTCMAACVNVLDARFHPKMSTYQCSKHTYLSRKNCTLKLPNIQPIHVMQSNEA